MIYNTPLYVAGGVVVGVGLILVHRLYAPWRLGRRLSITDAVTLGFTALGFAGGIKLFIVSFATLLYRGIMGIFGEDDLGIIAIAGAVLALVSYDTIIEVFT